MMPILSLYFEIIRKVSADLQKTVYWAFLTLCLQLATEQGRLPAKTDALLERSHVLKRTKTRFHCH